MVRRQSIRWAWARNGVHCASFTTQTADGLVPPTNLESGPSSSNIKITGAVAWKQRESEDQVKSR
jgi:hypothetical protein